MGETMSPRSAAVSVGALLLAGQLLLPEARAEDPPIVVHGSQTAADHLYYGGAADCDDYHADPGLTPKITPTKDDEAPLGDHTFRYTAERGYGVGPQVEYRRDQMTKLRDLSSLSVDVKSAAPDAAAVGVVSAMYETSPGVIWYGVAPIPAVPIDQWRTIDAASVVLNWRKNADPVSVQTTIQQFALDHGPGANPDRKARVGVLFGCNGADVFFDDLSIGVADDVTRWDLEGMRTHVTVRATQGADHVYTFLKPAYLKVSFSSPDSSAAVLRRELTHITCKQEHCLDRKYKNKSATMKIKAWPYADWSEWVFFPGGGGFEESPLPDVINWKVQPYISAAVNLQRPKRGQTLAVHGKVAPCHQGRKVSFQRKVNGHWRTLKTARATGCDDGARSPYSTYRMAVKLKTAGTWTWRIALDSIAPWRPGTSREFRQKVIVPAPHHPNPPPPPPSGGGYIPPTTDPDPPEPPGPHGRAAVGTAL